jgi:hypothetical protein
LAGRTVSTRQTLAVLIQDVDAAVAAVGGKRSDLANRKRSHEDSLNSPSADPAWPKVMMNFPFLSNFMMSELPKSAHGLRRRITTDVGCRTTPGLAALACLAQPAPSAPRCPAKVHHLPASDHPDIAVSTGYDPMGENPRMRALPETIKPAPKFSSLSRRRTIPEIGATLDPAQPLSSQRSNTQTWSSGGTYTLVVDAHGRGM